jgi:DNA-binding transcriptional ArsR family regulator
MKGFAGLFPIARVDKPARWGLVNRSCELSGFMLQQSELRPAELETYAAQAAAMLRSIANKSRLLVLCNLVDGEKSVGELQRIIGISQSALSQHLATLRAKRLVAVRREAQTIYYRLNGPEATAVLQTLYALYCGPARQGAEGVFATEEGR